MVGRDTSGVVFNYHTLETFLALIFVDFLFEACKLHESSFQHSFALIFSLLIMLRRTTKFTNIEMNTLLYIRMNMLQLSLQFFCTDLLFNSTFSANLVRDYRRWGNVD